MALCGLVVASLLAFDLDAGAHTGATGVVKERMDLMVSMGRSLKTISDMFRRKTAYDPAIIASRSREISDHSRALADLFPADSIKGPSEATAAIWQDWAEFERLADRLAAESEKLAEIAQQSSFGHANRQFLQMARLCTECHTRFRAAAGRTASR